MKIILFIAFVGCFVQLAKCSILRVQPTSNSSTCSGVVYRHNCIWLPYKTPFGMSDKKDAADYCYSQGGDLVDIVNKEMYELVYDYASLSITTSSPYGTFYVWLAMLYTSEDQLVRQSSGGPVSYVRWYHPKTHRKSGSIIWTVADHNHLNVGYTGYWTDDGDYNLGFPLCTKYMG
uniref:uncharacterized protein LOC108949436 n=1 Tax=Ciona intestinalis TaxID=7719 RepID=UPI00089DC052|nr:uncharacterized protein LOC108949436 [Ciona intestinalis]|eukprot:XP_026690175.1 uncharacterized protein LOC108949436 [Ciona intestinalis]